MERQALRDAVVRCNAEGLAGLEDRPKSGRPPGLTEGEEAALAAMILRGPDPERDGISVHTREDLAGLIQDCFGKRYHPAAACCMELERGRSSPTPVWGQAVRT